MNAGLAFTVLGLVAATTVVVLKMIGEWPWIRRVTSP